VIEILYDHREEASGVPEFLAAEELFTLRRAQLSVGDYIVSQRLAIERKSGVDFVNSLKDGRLRKQAQELKENFPLAVILIHGRVSFPPAAVEGAYASLLRRGVTIINLQNEQQAAGMIARLAKQENDPTARQRPKIGKKSPDPQKISESVLTSFPGISVVRAQSLLKHFGSPAAVLQASAAELQEVEGIGKKSAERLATLFQYDYRDIPW
jgi:ERCC4-type nuclease